MNQYMHQERRKSRKDAVYVTTSKHATYKAILGIFRRTRQTNSTQNLHFPKQCIIFAPSTNENAIRAPQGHLLRPRSVTIDDQRQSSIKTQKEHYSKADRRHRATNKTPDTRAVTNAPTIS